MGESESPFAFVRKPQSMTKFPRLEVRQAFVAVAWELNCLKWEEAKQRIMKMQQSKA
ncbi:unnamed protein product [Sphenostylis stenocarpa]|uniref:Uncharacterized protein n=1 Tax=Sphenostylis stenocarpa TaxID=92480 RepID=A0AA86RU97_9FABA|nr:unnamed protein product [Sphenostylis stenocarpa]